MLRHLVLLSLLSGLIAPCAGVQTYFSTSIANLLQVKSPFGTAQSRLIAKHASSGKVNLDSILLSQPGAKTRNAKFAKFVQLGVDHPELEPIIKYLESIILILDAEDAADGLLLDNTRSNHTAAAATTTEVKKTLSDKRQASSDASAVCTAKTNGEVQDKQEWTRDVLECEQEIEQVARMRSALKTLKTIGTSEQQIQALSSDLLQTGSQNLYIQEISSLADKISSATDEDKAPFKTLTLLGRDYFPETGNLHKALDELDNKINVRKNSAQAKIDEIGKTLEHVCKLADEARIQVVQWESKESVASIDEEAAKAGLDANTMLVNKSKQENNEIRTTISTIKTKIQELAEIPTTKALQTLPASMLQLHMSKFEDIVESIKTLLHNIEARLDQDELAESNTKKGLRDAWDSESNAQNGMAETCAVQSSTLATLNVRLADTTGSKDTAERARDDEIQSQIREKAMLSQLRVLLSNLAATSTESNALSTHSSQAMLALAMARNHEDVIKDFEALIDKLEAEMDRKKAELEAEYNKYLEKFTPLKVDVEKAEFDSSKADADKQASKERVAAALAAYEAASSKLDANNDLRGKQRAILAHLLVQIEALKV